MAKEIKSAMLREWRNGFSCLIVVDEDYDIHTVSAESETMSVFLEGVELPNFKWLRSSDDYVYFAKGHQFNGYYNPEDAFELLKPYYKKENTHSWSILGEPPRAVAS